jgi:hypothetical protein
LSADARRENMSDITTDQIGELIAQGKSRRVTRELLQAFLQNPQSVNGKPNEYVVSVDYGKKLEDMIAVGQYDWKNGDINSKNFQVTGGEGVVETKLELVHLNKVASTKEVEAYLEENGFRPATLEELLAFGATYPDVQREFPIVARVSSWVNRDGSRGVSYLSSYGSGRSLNLFWDDNRWREICRFLAVRK